MDRRTHTEPEPAPDPDAPDALRPAGSAPADLTGAGPRTRQAALDGRAGCMTVPGSSSSGSLAVLPFVLLALAVARRRRRRPVGTDRLSF